MVKYPVKKQEGKKSLFDLHFQHSQWDGVHYDSEEMSGGREIMVAEERSWLIPFYQYTESKKWVQALNP